MQHLQWTRRAIREGVDLRGFFFWSLMDTYEWNQGTRTRYGLYSVADDPRKTRLPRPAVEAYREVIKAREVPESWARRYPIAPE